MKKALLRVLLLICGLNVFTACYGPPPEDWLERSSLPEEQEQTGDSGQSAPSGQSASSAESSDQEEYE